jgi:hypothetical protein
MAEESRPLPAELERRLALVELDSQQRDFDASSWFWMILLGAVIPAGLLIAGWFHHGPP